MNSPTAFQPVLHTVFQSPEPDQEIIISKQAVLSEYGRDVRAAINQLPSDVSNGLIGEYSPVAPQFLNQLENSITARELSLDNVEAENDLDAEWLTGASDYSRKNIDERSLSNGDEDWNTPSPNF